MLDRIKKYATEYFNDVVDIRRYLHAHPELSWQENNTAKYIKKCLQQKGISYQSGIAKNGIVAIIRGNNADSKCFALRADMDALPIAESTDAAYKSCNEGVMHACGHDVHTASLLGTAFILQQLSDSFEGSVKLIFQPSEEQMPSGAQAMVNEGVLHSPPVCGIAAQHVSPELEQGIIGFCEGPFMASADEIYITVIGKGGHAASPHRLIDPILISAQILLSLQQIVSRSADPTTPTVLSFGDIHGYGATNVIPDKVTLKGTLRTYDEPWRKIAIEKIKSITTGIAESMGGKAIVDIPEGCPYVSNDVQLTRRLRAYATLYVGENNVVDMKQRMGAEDFSFYSHHLPACFYRLGTGNIKKGITSNLHTSTFDIDEDALSISTGLMAWMAINELSYEG